MSDLAVMEKPEESAPPPVRAGKPAKAKDLTPEEEQVLATRFAMCEKGQRFLLLQAFEGNAHKAYNKRKGVAGRCGNFEEYAQNVLGLQHDAAYLSRLVGAAKVERAIAGESFNMLQLSAPEGEAPFRPKLSVRAAQAIARLPETEWKSIYEEATAPISNGVEITPSELATNLTRITGRRYKELHPETAPAPKQKRTATAPAPTAAKSGSAPVTDHSLPPYLDAAGVTGKTYDEVMAEEAAEKEFIEGGGTSEEWAAQQEGAAVNPGATEGVSSAGGDYQAAQEEIAVLRSFVKAFIAACESEGNVAGAFQELYNDATEYAKAHGL